MSVSGCKGTNIYVILQIYLGENVLFYKVLTVAVVAKIAIFPDKRIF